MYRMLVPLHYSLLQKLFRVNFIPMNFKNKVNDLLDDLEVNITSTKSGRTSQGKFILRSLELWKKSAIQQSESVLDECSEPLISPVYLLKALLAKKRGQDTLSLKFFEKAINATGSTSDILRINGDISHCYGFIETAIRSYDKAVELSPLNYQAFLGRGKTYSEMGKVTSAIDNLLQATLLNPESAKGYIVLGNEYRNSSMNDAAIKCYRTALNREPENAIAQSALDSILELVIPHWHAAMLNDYERTEAFETAINATVKPETYVLDIGTGTGLLAMLASRAGARHVIACEAVEILAETATKIIKDNGFDDKISIIHKHSEFLSIGVELEQKADVLIAELVDASLLGENIIPVINDAVKRLCKPDVVVIPCGATVFAAPFESEKIYKESRVDKVAGLDIQLFNRINPRMRLQTDLSKFQWKILSKPTEIFKFEFPSKKFVPKRHKVKLTPNTDGMAHGIALWFDLQLNKDIFISTSPFSAPTHWKQSVYPLSSPMMVRKNKPISLLASYTENRINVELGG